MKSERSFVITDITNRLLALAASYVLVYFLLRLMALPSNTAVVTGLILISAAAAYFAGRDKTVLKALAITGGVIVLLTLAGLAIPGAVGNVLKVIINAFTWYSAYFRNLVNYSPLYAYIMVALVTAASYTVTHLLICRMGLHIVAIMLTALPITIYYSIYSKLLLPLYYLFIIVCLVGFLLNNFIRKYKKQGGEYAPLRMFYIWMAAFCIVIFAVSYAIPSSKYPVQIKWLDEKINEYIEAHRKTTFSKLSIKEQFTEDKTYLGAPLKFDNIPVMTVSAPRKMYLRGTTSDTYTGNQWLNSDNTAFPYLSTYKNELSDEVSDLLNGTTLLNNLRRPVNDFYASEIVTVKYARIKTQTLFTQLKTNTLQTDTQKKLASVRIALDGTLISTRNFSTGFTYRINTFSINYGSTNLIGLLRKSDSSIYGLSLDGQAETSFTSDDVAKMKARADAIRARYLQLPDFYSENVKELARTVTARATTNYDKAKAIESYLSGSFAYTETPDTPDSERDFVEQFLFEIQKGYCTHFASAMVVMLRSLDIPARYVEGYILPELPEPDKTTYKVTNKQAHAWVEAYFDGFGWVTFEPTAGFTKSFYDTQSKNFKTQPSPSASAKTTPTPAVTATRNNSLTPNNSPTAVNAKPTPRNIIENLVPPFMKNPVFIRAFLITFSILLAIAALLLVLYLINRRRVALFMSRITAAPPKTGILMISYKWFAVLELLDMRKKPEQTASEFLAELNRHRELRKTGAEDLIKIFVEARYSDNQLTPKDKNTALNSYLSLLNYYILVKGKARFTIMRYLLGMI